MNNSANDATAWVLYAGQYIADGERGLIYMRARYMNMAGWNGQADLPDPSGGREKIIGDNARLYISNRVVTVEPVSRARQFPRREKALGDVVSAQKASRIFIFVGLRLDFLDGDVWYFWPVRRWQTEILWTLRQRHVRVRGGVYRLPAFGSCLADYTARTDS